MSMKRFRQIDVRLTALEEQMQKNATIKAKKPSGIIVDLTKTMLDIKTQLSDIADRVDTLTKRVQQVEDAVKTPNRKGKK